MIRMYYELLLNANQTNCDLRRQYSNLSATNFPDFDNFTEFSGNLTETGVFFDEKFFQAQKGQNIENNSNSV